MMNIHEIKELIPFLKTNSVSRFKLENLEIDFSSVLVKPQEIKSIGDFSKETLPTQVADDLFNYDKTLHWSGSGAEETGPMPLTGEETLAAP